MFPEGYIFVVTIVSQPSQKSLGRNIKMNKLKPDAILFDMDGVLVDSLDSWWYSLNAALKQYGKEEVTRDTFIERYWGRDLQYNLRVMGLSYEILSFCNKTYGEHVDAVKIYPDTKKVLERLKSYDKCVITNTPRGCTVQILKNLDIQSFFNFILTSDEVSMGKPSPEIVFKACNMLKVEPRKTILVGDTSSDVEAGHAAGCKVIGIKTRADYTIDNLIDLLNIVEIV